MQQTGVGPEPLTERRDVKEITEFICKYGRDIWCTPNAVPVAIAIQEYGGPAVLDRPYLGRATGLRMGKVDMGLKDLRERGLLESRRPYKLTDSFGQYFESLARIVEVAKRLQLAPTV